MILVFAHHALLGSDGYIGLIGVDKVGIRNAARTLMKTEVIYAQINRSSLRLELATANEDDVLEILSDLRMVLWSFAYFFRLYRLTILGNKVGFERIIHTIQFVPRIQLLEGHKHLADNMCFRRCLYDDIGSLVFKNP